jgi:hypothetical protein
MKKITLLLAFLLLGNLHLYSQDFNFQRTWSTYYGDENLRFMDGEIDSQGNVYLMGTVYGSYINAIQFTTANAIQPIYGGGTSDAFLVKINPNGSIAWATYFGGENTEIAEAIAIDKDDNIFIIGETNSTQNIATPNCYQPNLNGLGDTFLAKFSVGGTIVWSTYFGGEFDTISNFEVNDINNKYAGITCDNFGNIFTYSLSDGINLATTGTFQTTRQDSNFLISKFSTTGNRIWSTYYGINDSRIRAINSNISGIYIAGYSLDCPPNPYNSYFGTSNGFQPLPENCRDVFLSKFSFDGERIWSSYYGSVAGDRITANAIKSFENNIYMAIANPSDNNLATAGSFQESGPYSNLLIKFNDNGERVWATYCGTNSFKDSSNANVNVDNQGNVYLCGNTALQNNISTTGSYQSSIIGDNLDGYIVKFSPNGEKIWGTYYGGSQTDYDPHIRFHQNSFYLFGLTSSTQGFSTVGSYQENYINHGNPILYDMNKANIYVSKFDPLPLSANDFEKSKITIYPNPSDGIYNFNLTVQDIDTQIQVFNLLGEQVYSSILSGKQENKIDLSNLAKGCYLVKLSNSESITTQKLIKK